MIPSGLKIPTGPPGFHFSSSGPTDDQTPPESNRTNIRRVRFDVSRAGPGFVYRVGDPRIGSAENI
jgi:hypothetical protein